MADRYQDRPFPAGDDKGESDPLAELARLIGQTDPFGSTGRANPKAQPRGAPAPDPYQRQPPPEDSPPAGPPPWMQRANRPEIRKPVYDEPEPEQDYQPSPVHPLHRYAAQHQHQAPQEDYQQEPYDEAAGEVDPSRYDEALYGQIASGAQDQREPAYPDDPYAYQDGYEEEDQGEKRRGGVVTVIAVLALAVIGTGAAFAYRSYVASPRSGDPPIIRADNSPTKIVPSPGDSASKTPDRMPGGGDGTEKIVPREEAPVDINGRAGSGPRVVFPPLNQNGNPPSAASVAPNNVPVASAGPVPTNGTMPNNEPRKIKTFSVRGDQTDGGAPGAAAPPPPGTKPAQASKTGTRTAPPSSANASANAPLSLSPQGAEATPAAEPRTRVAATNPTQTAPAPASPAVSSGGAFLVQVSSQPSEAVAQSSFRALQSKFPSVLGSQTPVIKRADLGEKGVVYRAMVGPFGSKDEAVQFCESLKSAGGQCFVPRN
jgi:SPOR domain